MTGISLIIPTYNRARYLRDTLQSVAQLRCPDGIEREVLVINNNCTDETRQVVEQAARSFPVPLRHIVEEQQGLCFGRNRGLAEARYEHLAYLDDDIRVCPDWIPGYFEAVDAYGADAVVGPVFPLFEQEKPEYLVGRALEIISSGYSQKGTQIQVLLAETAHELPGCNFGVRRSLAQSMGGFNVTLDRVGSGLLAGGDTEFGHRLVAAGKRTVYHPLCAIDHIIVPDKTTRAYLRKRAYGLGVTQRILCPPDARLTPRNRLRRLVSAGRQRLRSLGWWMRRRPGESFSCEIESLENLGFVFTNPTRSPIAKVDSDRKQSASPGSLPSRPAQGLPVTAGDGPVGVPSCDARRN